MRWSLTLIISLLTYPGFANQPSSPYPNLEPRGSRLDTLDKLYWQIDGIRHIKWFNTAPSPWDDITLKIFPFSNYIVNYTYIPSPIPPLPQAESFNFKIHYAPFPFSRLKLFLGLPASEGISFTHIQPIIKKWTIDATFEAYNSDGWLINQFQKRHSITLGTHIPLDSTKYIYIKGNISKDRFGTNNGLITYIPNLPPRIQPVNDNFSYSALEEKSIYVSLLNKKDFEEPWHLYRYTPRRDTTAITTYLKIIPHLNYEDRKFTHFSNDTLSLERTILELKTSLIYKHEVLTIVKRKQNFKYKRHYLFINFEPTFSALEYQKLDSSWFYGTGLQGYIHAKIFNNFSFMLSGNISYLSNQSLNYLTHRFDLLTSFGSTSSNYNLTFKSSQQFSPWFWQNPLMEEHSVSLYLRFLRSNFSINLGNLIQFFPLYEVYDTSQTLVYAGKLLTVKHDINFGFGFNKHFGIEPSLKIFLSGSVYSYQSPAVLPVYDAFVAVQLRPGKKRNFHMMLAARAIDNIPALFYAPLHYWAYTPINPGFNITVDFEIGWQFRKALIKGRINNIPAFINPELYRPVKNWLWAPLIHFSLLWDMFY